MRRSRALPVMRVLVNQRVSTTVSIVLNPTGERARRRTGRIRPTNCLRATSIIETGVDRWSRNGFLMFPVRLALCDAMPGDSVTSLVRLR